MVAAASRAVSYTHLRAHETPEHLVCRLLLEKKRRPPRSTRVRSSAASDVYKRQVAGRVNDQRLAGLGEKGCDGRGRLAGCLLYTSPSPRDSCASRMPSSA